ncbi:14871_t:CDS:10, partial [Gigaspora rosea]
DPITDKFVYTIAPEIVYHLNNVALIAIIKHSSTLDPNRSVQSQIQFISLLGPATGESGSANVSPYEALHSCIHHAVAPYFDAYVNKRHDDAKMGISMTKKKIAELELALVHLQQNVEIPKISLNIHTVVQQAVEKARQEGRRISVDFINQALLSDTAFLNRLQGDVNGWIKEIQKVTKLSRDPASGTTMQEINFWLNMETALEDVDGQLKSDQIVLTLDILRHAKRFHATVSFIADTGLKEAKEKDFPLGELLSAPNVEKIKETLNVVFAHFTKKMRLSPYPIKKALALIEAISRDLNDTWDELIKEFTIVARDVMRIRSDKFIPIKINPAHDKLQERVAFVRNFRKQHDQLHQIAKVMSEPKNTTRIVVKDENNFVQQEEGVDMNDINSMEELKVAYESVKDIDVLDVSIEGTEIWMQAENAYNERISRVENQIIASLQDRLGTCKNANEMFRVFSKFNALFVRPKIQRAIQEYQNELIERVKKDIAKLHDKFNQQYRKSEANRMAQLRDLPAISGAMIWARQIERQLQTYMKRVEDALGKGWEMYAEGQKLQFASNNFRKKLDTRPNFEAWQKDILQRSDLNGTGRLFEITRNRAQGNILQLGVNFDPQIITLFKEVRNLLWLNHQVPYNISTSAKVAKRVYPFAVSLMETVRTYAQTVQKVQKHPNIIMLVASYRNGVQAMIAKGITFEWKYFVETYDNRYRGGMGSHENQHVTFVREFANTVSEFQDKVDALINHYEDISSLIEDLKTCAYQLKKFKSNLEKIQKLIDRLNLESYSNLDACVAQLDKWIETVLSQRLHRSISSWTTEFISSNDDSTTDSISHEISTSKGVKSISRRTLRNDSFDGEIPTIAKTEKPVLQQSIHIVRIRNQVIYLDPPIEDARTKLYNQLDEWLCEIHGSHYDIDLQFRGSTISRETTYSNLLPQIPVSSLENAYEVIESKLKEVAEYVNKWFQFQSLWGLEPNYIYDRLGDDLNKWKRILSEIKKSRATLDNSDVERSFGVIIVNYEQAQSKVNAEYDKLQRGVLDKFAIKLGDYMREFHSSVSNSRKELENKSIGSNNTSEAVALITSIQDLKRKINKWHQDIKIFREGQKILEQQQYQFPIDWLYIEQIEGEWSSFNDILDRKNDQIQEQIDELRLKIVTYDKNTAVEIKNFVSDWDKNIQSDKKTRLDIAISTLETFERRVTRLKDEYNMICRAKEALGMNLTTDNSLDSVLEEIRDLKSVWSSFSQSINELKETQWHSVVTTQEILRKLENLFISIKELPYYIRLSSAFGVLIYAVLSLFLPSIYELKETPQSSVVPREIRKQLKNLIFLEMLPTHIRTSKAFGALVDEVLSIFLPSLNELKKTSWSSVTPRKIRRQLGNLLNDIKELPSSIQAFEDLVDSVRAYVKINPILSELKSKALKDHHWNKLFKTLKLENWYNITEMTVGQVWDLDLKKHEKIIKNIVAHASGEENKN